MTRDGTDIVASHVLARFDNCIIHSSPGQWFGQVEWSDGTLGSTEPLGAIATVLSWYKLGLHPSGKSRFDGESSWSATCYWLLIPQD